MRPIQIILQFDLVKVQQQQPHFIAMFVATAFATE